MMRGVRGERSGERREADERAMSPSNNDMLHTQNELSTTATKDMECGICAMQSDAGLNVCIQLHVADERCCKLCLIRTHTP